MEEETTTLVPIERSYGRGILKVDMSSECGEIRSLVSVIAEINNKKIRVSLEQSFNRSEK